jgi:hypothetical protein
MWSCSILYPVVLQVVHLRVIRVNYVLINANNLHHLTLEVTKIHQLNRCSQFRPTYLYQIADNDFHELDANFHHTKTVLWAL